MLKTPDHTSFTDEDDIRAKYYPESIALLKLLTGARHVVPFDHNPESLAAARAPRARLATRAVRLPRDVVPITLRYPDHNGETYGVRFSPGHRWWYMRGMRPDEFVLIKCFDSQDDGQTAVFALHTAFDDPTTPEGASFRESVKLRMLISSGPLAAMARGGRHIHPAQKEPVVYTSVSTTEQPLRDESTSPRGGGAERRYAPCRLPVAFVREVYSYGLCSRTTSNGICEAVTYAARIWLVNKLSLYKPAKRSSPK
ncbi:predicted protein [Postia placenta Mad-698-R]|nr:predicted protein [Postia placenta Mad-698-R]